MTTTDPAQARPVRSFVRRAGRLTRAQAKALERLWPEYAVACRNEPLDLAALFGRRAPCIVEIGFGSGAALLERARQEPQHDLLGIEVHEPGIGHCLLGIERLGLRNVRLIRGDALEVLRDRIPAGSLRGVVLLFPDPWPKKRHHKRRIVQPEFIALVTRALEPDGFLHIATDWPEYAAHIQAVLAGQTALVVAPGPLPARGRTRFETRGERLGHAIWEGLYRRVAAPAGR